MSLGNDLQYFLSNEFVIGKDHPQALDDTINRALIELVAKFDEGNADTQVTRNHIKISAPTEITSGVVTDDIVYWDEVTSKWIKAVDKVDGIIDVENQIVYIFGIYEFSSISTLVPGTNYYLDGSSAGDITTDDSSGVLIGRAFSTSMILNVCTGGGTSGGGITSIKTINSQSLLGTGNIDTPIVTLTDSIGTTDSTIAASATAVKTAYDKGVDAYDKGVDAYALALSGSRKCGDVFIISHTDIPTDSLECDGSVISRTTYSDLFSKIGTIYGAGDGSTTFNIPDLRGEFIRGFDNGRGVDNGRSVGSFQLDALQGHGHALKEYGNKSGSTSVSRLGSAASFDGGSLIGKPTTYGSYGSPRFTVETRPRNIAMIYCIKY